jgi:uncharacterized protein (DUF697 family)
MTDDEKSSCHKIIHAAATTAAGVGGGMAQLPGSDNAVITPIQIGMIIALGKVFNKSITESAAFATLGTVAASTVGRAVSQFLVGWIPGFGNLLNASTAFGITETIGWAIADDFDKHRG